MKEKVVPDSGLKYRLKQILKYAKLNQSEFAEKIHVTKATISGLLSGRNNPSYDFLKKFKNVYPEINLDWFLFGNGKMLLTDDDVPPPPPPPPPTPPTPPTPPPPEPPVPGDNNGDEPNELIIIFGDKTFQTLKKRQ